MTAGEDEGVAIGAADSMGGGGSSTPSAGLKEGVEVGELAWLGADDMLSLLLLGAPAEALFDGLLEGEGEKEELKDGLIEGHAAADEDEDSVPDGEGKKVVDGEDDPFEEENEEGDREGEREGSGVGVVEGGAVEGELEGVVEGGAV